MAVPDKDVGKIIGKGGRKIRELQDANGARIRVLLDEENEDGLSDVANQEQTPGKHRGPAQRPAAHRSLPRSTGSCFGKRDMSDPKQGADTIHRLCEIDNGE